MSGNSSANNSWTILTPQETVAETLKPLAEGAEHHGESLTSAAGSGENQPADCAESAEGLPVEGHLVSEEETAELSGDASTEQHTAVTDASAPTSLEVPGSFVAGSDALSQSEGLPEDSALSGPDKESSSDSHTHTNPCPDEPSAPLLSTETLGGVEFTQEEESLTQEGTQHLLNGEELQQGGEESELFPKTPDLWKQADPLVDSEVDEGRTEKTGEEADPELRRRRSLLAVLERIGRTEEEEEGEEEFQLPQREEDSGFSVNKCILGAVILLGLGTIFFSESDYGTMELKDAEAAGKQEWLNPEVPPLPVDADGSVLLNKLAEENQQVSVLQAQLQEQKEELKVAKVQAEEGAKEQLRWEEMEKENTAGEAAQAAVDSITSPPSGQPENSMQDSAGSTEAPPKKPRDDQREKRKDVKKDKMDMGEKKEWKERNKSEWKEKEKWERKDGGKKEWKQGNHEQGKFDKENKDKDSKQKRHGDETRKGKEKEWKKEKTSRGDGGKQWKDKEGNNEWVEKSERKERKEEKDWKKANHENLKDGKQWRGKEEKKDWKVGKDHGGKGKEEWKKGKDGLEESGKEKWEKKDSKKKELKKKDGDWRSKDSKEGKVKGGRKQWEESKYHGQEKGKNENKQWNENKRKSKNGKEEWRKKDERKQWEKKEDSWKKGGERDKKHNGDWKKERSSHKEEHNAKVDHGHEAERLWADGKLPRSHSRPSMEQPEYWAQQRLRLQHSPKPPQQCSSLETCALSERLLPVPLPEFEAILQSYLAKAEEAGVEESKREELKKLSSEFFRDGVFVHDQTSFQEFVEDLGDILEDMVEGDEEEEEDSDLEDAMEEFEREVMKRFSVPVDVETEGWSKESGRGRG